MHSHASAQVGPGADADAAGGFLLATDVDGTLLTRDYRLLPEVRAAVRHAQAHGVGIMLATARGPAALEVVLAALGEVDYAICFGGALVLERRGRRWGTALPEQITLSPDAVAQVLDSAATRELALGVYTEAGVHTGATGEWFRGEFAHTGEPVFATRLDPAAGAVFKLLAISEPARADELERLRTALPEGLEGVYSHPNYLEIMVRGVSKGDALERFCRAKRLDRSAVVAAGDGDNDVSLFLAAGHSAAMADASPAARGAANWAVAPGEPAGLAAVIGRYASSLWRIPPPPNP